VCYGVHVCVCVCVCVCVGQVLAPKYRCGCGRECVSGRVEGGRWREKFPKKSDSDLLLSVYECAEYGKM